MAKKSPESDAAPKSTARPTAGTARDTNHTSRSYGYEYGWGYGGYASDYDWFDGGSLDLREAAKALLYRLRDYDARRVRLEESGGTVWELMETSRLLTEPLEVETHYGTRSFKLTDQREARSAVRDIDYGAHLQVRRLPTTMPTYYLCRRRSEYLFEYSLIVEDVYTSPGYPFDDERFVKLMVFGKEKYYLRLSQFRAGVESQGTAWRVGNRKLSTDEALYTLGRHIFQAAWHEDQRPGMLTAEHFGLWRFRLAIELLYLLLSGDLCSLRAHVCEGMLDFFATVYPQPAIRAILKSLGSQEGSALNELPKQALKRYARLARAFAQFVRVEVKWGPRETKLPLYKLLFANLNRLDEVAKRVRSHPKLELAAKTLEDEAAAIILELTGLDLSKEGEWAA